jgi:hypothetical protein
MPWTPRRSSTRRPTSRPRTVPPPDMSLHAVGVRMSGGPPDR